MENNDSIKENMSLDDIDSIENYGIDLMNEIKEKSIELSKNCDTDSFVYDESYSKLVKKIFSFKSDIEKEIEEYKKISDKILHSEAKTPLNLFGLIPFITRQTNKMFNNGKEKIDIVRISVRELKEQKYEYLRQLEIGRAHV